MNKGKVLVTGGAGFIGSHVCKDLLKNSFDVRVLDNFSTSTPDNLTKLFPHLELMEEDVRNGDGVAKAIRGCRYVIHLAALTSVPLSFKNPRTTLETNVFGTLNVFEAALRQNVEAVLAASSCSIYGQVPVDAPIPETYPGRPLSPYALSKLQSEQLGKFYQDQHRLTNVHFRIFNVYGPNQNPRSPYAAVIPKFIESFLDGVRPSIFGSGRQCRDFIYVEDVAAAFTLALSRPALPEILNIGTGQPYTLIDLVSILEGISGVKLSPVFAPPRTGDITYSCADTQLADHHLGVVPQVSLEQGLRKTYAWHAQNGSKKAGLARS